MELLIILASGSAPDAVTWNKALAEARIPAAIEQVADLSKHSGFLPVTVNGKPTGLYFSVQPYPDIAKMYPSIAGLKVGKPVVYSLGYGGDMKECAAVFYSASALVDRFGGIAFEPQAGAEMSASDLISAAKQCEVMADAESTL